VWASSVQLCQQLLLAIAFTYIHALQCLLNVRHVECECVCVCKRTHIGGQVTFEYAALVTWMHAFTVTSVITGLKPAINFIYLLVFNCVHTRHLRLLRTINKVDAEYARAFGYTQNTSRMQTSSIIAVVTIGAPDCVLTPVDACRRGVFVHATCRMVYPWRGVK
jgi:hypothetical protein